MKLNSSATNCHSNFPLLLDRKRNRKMQAAARQKLEICITHYNTCYKICVKRLLQGHNDSMPSEKLEPELEIL